MIKVFEAFAGYGGGSFALKKLGVDFEVVGYSEIDKNAIKCYDLNHPGIKNFGDISKVESDDVPDFDLFLGGFPCQDVSIAGKRDLSKGRTNLYKECLRICRDKQPKYILLENVAGLLSMGDSRKLIDIIVSDFRSIGYSVCWKKLNSKDFGIPQSRDRVWIVCFRDDVYVPFKFQFPIEEPLKIVVRDILEKDVDKKYLLKPSQIRMIEEKLRHRGEMLITKDYSSTLLARDYKDGGKRIQIDVSGKGYNSQQDRVYSDDGVMCCIPCANPQNKVNIYSINRLEGFYDQASRWGVYDENGISPTLVSAMGMGGGFVPMISQLVGDRDNSSISLKEDVANTIPANPMSDREQFVVYDDYNSKLREDALVGTITPNTGSRSERTGQKIVIGHSRDETGKDISYHEKEEWGTIKSSQRENQQDYVRYENIYRRLTPRECFRLMGFLNDEIKLDGLSDTAKYKLAGNGWEINLASKVLKNMLSEVI